MTTGAVIFIVIASSCLSSITAIFIGCKIIERILDSYNEQTKNICGIVTDKMIEVQTKQTAETARLNEVTKTLNEVTKTLNQLNKFQ